MDSDASTPIVLVRPRWRRAFVIAALLLAPVGVLAWPWRFLPLRWQYPFAIGSAERAIEVIEKVKASSGRLPSQDELRKALDPDDWPCSECYEIDGESYILTATASFDYRIDYDSRIRKWRRSP